MTAPEPAPLASRTMALLLDAGASSVAVIVAGLIFLPFAEPSVHRLLVVLLPVMALRSVLNLWSRRRRGSA